MGGFGFLLIEHEVEEAECQQDEEEAEPAHRSDLQSSQCVGAPAFEAAAFDRLSCGGDEVDHEAQIMQAQQTEAEDLLLIDQVPDVRAGEAGARRAAAVSVERPVVTREPGVPQVEAAL